MFAVSNRRKNECALIYLPAELAGGDLISCHEPLKILARHAGRLRCSSDVSMMFIQSVEKVLFFEHRENLCPGFFKRRAGYRERRYLLGSWIQHILEHLRQYQDRKST